MRIGNKPSCVLLITYVARSRAFASTFVGWEKKYFYSRYVGGKLYVFPIPGKIHSLLKFSNKN